MKSASLANNTLKHSQFVLIAIKLFDRDYHRII